MPVFDVDKFTEHLRNNADSTGFGHGRCAYFVRQALQDVGYKPATWPVHAKDRGRSMLRAGFQPVKADDLSTFKLFKGDVAANRADAVLVLSKRLDAPNR